MITRLYEFDLELVIDARNVRELKLVDSQYLSTDQIRLITYQLLLGLRSVHSAGVVSESLAYLQFIHRDIKPANVLLSSTADVAV